MLGAGGAETILMPYIFVAAGLGLLLFGGEMLVRGAVDVARRLGVSPLIIGLTIVAYGTSAPELLVSLEANLAGAPGIAIGNVVGSNIANILLIVGCSALIYPISCRHGRININGIAVLGATLLLFALGLNGTIGPLAAIPMLGLLVGFTAYSYYTGRRDLESAAAALDAEGFEIGPKPVARDIVFLALGLVGVILGSHLLVTGAVELARSFGVSEATIGLTLVALGTSLPELATAVVAAYRRHSDVALGNVVGSNLFNILGIMGVVPLFGALPVPPAVVGFDFWVMLGTTVVFVGWTVARHSFGRIMAALFLFAYLAYIACHYFGISALATVHA